MDPPCLPFGVGRRGYVLHPTGEPHPPHHGRGAARTKGVGVRGRRGVTLHASGSPWHTDGVDDEELLAQAEEALTEIKVAHGLSDRHASVLAALRIRLKGSAGSSLEEMLAATGDLEPDRLDEAMAKTEGETKPSLDDLLSQEPKKPEWPS